MHVTPLAGERLRPLGHVSADGYIRASNGNSRPIRQLWEFFTEPLEPFEIARKGGGERQFRARICRLSDAVSARQHPMCAARTGEIQLVDSIFCYCRRYEMGLFLAEPRSGIKHRIWQDSYGVSEFGHAGSTPPAPTNILPVGRVAYFNHVPACNPGQSAITAPYFVFDAFCSTTFCATRSL